MNQILEHYARLVIIFMVIDIIWLVSFGKISSISTYVVILLILNAISTYFSYKYIEAKELKIIYLILVPFLLPIGMLIILIKKGKNRIEPF